MKTIDFKKFSAMDVVSRMQALAEIVAGTAQFASSEDEQMIKDFLNGFNKTKKS